MAAPGMEMLFCSVQKQLKCKEDALICCFHWCMVSSKFKCIGIGEEAPKDVASIKKSEVLPNGWNENSDFYTLLYQPHDSDATHLLKVVKMDDTLLLHVMRLSDSKVASINITTSDFCNDDLSSFESAYTHLDDLTAIFQSGIIQELTPAKSKSKASTSQTPRQQDRQREDHDPLRIPPRHGGQVPPEWGERSDPFAVGRGDLDPLAGGMGGGMIMDPFRGGPGRGMMPDHGAGLPGRLPRGAVPPGARFDPFGPGQPDRSGGMGPGGGNRAGPDPDHLPPPDYDDMFM